MQSQQKKVKWSRGETADALEERTDTGITQVSVSKLENIIADVYGNISRRPAFRMVPYADGIVDSTLINNTERAKMIPFKVSENDCVIFLFPKEDAITNNYPYYRIKNGKIVHTGYIHSLDQSVGIPTGYAQNNNFLIITSQRGIWKIQSTEIGESSISFSFNKYVYSGTWYTPGQKQTVVSNNEIPGLLFNSPGTTGYFQVTILDEENNIENNLYSALPTGLTFTADNVNNFMEYISVGSIIQFPNMGGQMRVEGVFPYYAGSTGARKLWHPELIFDGVLTINDPVPAQGLYCKVIETGLGRDGQIDIAYGYYANGQRIDYIYPGTAWMGHLSQLGQIEQIVVRNRAATSGFSQAVVTPTSGHSYRVDWATLNTASLSLCVYGEILAPAVKSNAVDNTVNTLTGFIELNQANATPRTATFSNQRLYLGGFVGKDFTDYGSVVVGSQIAKYNDFKNNYNTANESITIDIATMSREKVFHVVDYNGIQIFTDVAEYSYRDGAVLKQSSNGSSSDCFPMVFKSALLYVDKSKRYIRVAQYELKSNVYESTKINLLAKDDLIYDPVSMSSYEEKEHFTGTFLFVINDPTSRLQTHAELAVCNFLPQNQEVIWTRWDTVSFPYSFDTTETTTTIIHYGWRNDDTGKITYTNTPDPTHGTQLYKQDGTAETQFYQNTVESGGQDSISVIAARHETTETFYCWTVGGIDYYTTSSTPSVGDPLYQKQQDGTFLMLTADRPDHKVWATSGSQITVAPILHYWYGDYTGTAQYFYNKYWSTSATPQVGDTVYGYYVQPVTHDGTYPEPFVVTAVSGSTITIQRINVDTYQDITIVATKTPGPDDIAAVDADRDSATDETSTLVSYDMLTLLRNADLDVKHTETTTVTHTGEATIVCDTTQVDNKVYFLCGIGNTFRIAELDYDATLDFNAPVIENKYKPSGLILEGATVQVYDGTEYKFDATIGADGTLSVDTTELEHPYAGFWINATLESHPIDIQGKTYTEKKRIGKAVAVVRETNAGAFTVCDKTGYMSPDKKSVNFYGCTGMKDLIRYTIKNKQGAKFTIESLTMIIEHGTLDS